MFNSDTNEDDDIESSETPNNLEAFVEQCDNLIEAKYLLKHLLDTTLEKSIEASKAASELKQWKAKAEQLEQEQRINGQLMSQLIGEDKNVASDVTEVIRARKESSSSPEAKRANNAMTCQLTRSVSPIDDSTSQTSGQDSMKKSSVSADVYNDDGEDDAFQPGASEEPVPAKQKRMDTRSSFSRHSRFRNTIASITPGSKLRKYHSVAGLPAAKSFASASMGCEPSTSTSNTQAIPINSSKMRELLNRLVPKWSNENSEFSSKSGRKAEVVEVSPQESYKFGGRKYLSRTFTIYGHAKPVISIAANDELLITGSKDRTAKIWDLHTGTEKCVLKSHPNNVTAVKLVPNNPNMALTVSLFTVKWYC
uniref:WD_REPEATS_REGION domain-containing protein n=1 Tax=Acrobeloides nanus TaxID=290746 RepID=A0A914CWS0_9BILA